jgi:hypothetical protein
MASNTVRLHRVLRAPTDRVFRAMTDADAMVKWLPPYGFTARMHQHDPKVGGTYKMSFTNFGSGKSHSFGGKYRARNNQREDYHRTAGAVLSGSRSAFLRSVCGRPLTDRWPGLGTSCCRRPGPESRHSRWGLGD